MNYERINIYNEHFQSMNMLQSEDILYEIAVFCVNTNLWS